MESGTPRISPDTYARAVRDKLITDPYDPMYHKGARNPYTKAIITCEADYIEYVNEFIYDWLTSEKNVTNQDISKTDSSKSNTYYYVEAPNGMTVRVPADKLDSWVAADHEAPLTPAEEQLVENLLGSFYHKTTAEDKPSVTEPKTSRGFNQSKAALPSEQKRTVEKPIGYIPNSSYVPIPWWRSTKILARLGLVLIAAVLICSVIFVVVPGLPDPTAAVSSPPTVSTDPSPIIFPDPLPTPPNRKIFYSNPNFGEKIALLTIDATSQPASSGFYVKVRLAYTNTPLLTFFVRGGKEATVHVPLGTHEIFYASGTEWYGTDLLFGPDTSYFRADQLFKFYEEDDYVNGWTVTLGKQYDGNLDIDQISADEF